MFETLNAHFGGKIRLRICGILVEDTKILLVKHTGLGPAGFLWNPPGGGAHFGETYSKTLEREFLEETNLAVEVKDFLLFNEHISGQLHAMELFFKVETISGILKLGTDPELEGKEQMLIDIRFWSKEEIQKLPQEQFHKRLFDYFI